VLKTIFAALLFAMSGTVAPAFCADLSAAGRPDLQGIYAQSYGDPLAPFNEKMFWFNLKLGQGSCCIRWQADTPLCCRSPRAKVSATSSTNVNFISPRAANNLFQLRDGRMRVAKSRRFGINSTLAWVDCSTRR